jgi:hypothetical protein
MTAVEVLNNEYSSIIQFLDQSQQPSLSSDLNKYFKKVLILSAASYFEHEIQNILVEFISTASNDNPKVISFLKKKAISMQYHTYFTWGEKNEPDKPGKNANTFFSLFGDEFKTECEKEVKANAEIDKKVKSFLEIGHLRNILVHSNFAALNFDTKTTSDIYELYKNGLLFVEYVRQKLITAPNTGLAKVAV